MTKDRDRERFDLVLATVASLVLAFLGIAVHLIDTLYAAFTYYSPFTQILGNFLLLYMVGLLWYTYRHWKIAERKRMELEDIIGSISPGISDTQNPVLIQGKLLSLSVIDELTGLYNRRGFLAFAKQQLKLAQRTGKGVLLLFADLDGMKWINDNLGHSAGDAALMETSAILKETFRESDIIARMGGDEFAVIGVEADKETEKVTLERLYENIRSKNAERGRNFQLSLSIGSAYYNPGDPSSLDEMLDQADASMYEQKRERRIEIAKNKSVTPAG